MTDWDVWCLGDKVTWVQCDVCQLWFHFHCIGVDSISEHEDYMCLRCTEKRYTSLVNAAQQSSTRPHAVDPADYGTESAASSDSSSSDEEYDEHMKEFYAESVDSYIIRSNRKSPGASTSGAEPRTNSDKVIVLE